MRNRFLPRSRRFVRRRYARTMLSLCTLTTATLALVPPISAQTVPPMPTVPTKTDDTAKAGKTEKSTIPPTNAPSVKSQAATPGSVVLPDYRSTAAAPVVKPEVMPLPLYGYDFFKERRDFIDRKRAFQKKALADALRQADRATNDATEESGDETDSTSRGSRRDSNRDDEFTPRGDRDSNGRNQDDRSGTGNGDRDRYNDRRLGDSNSGSRGDNSRDDSRDRTGDRRRYDENNNDSSDSPRYTPRRSRYASEGAPAAYGEMLDPLDNPTGNPLMTPPADYHLAPGDTIVFRYHSRTLEERESAATLDPAGAILLQNMGGRLNLRGKTIEGAEATMRDRIMRYYKNVSVTVELGRLRTFPIAVLGEAYLSGTFTAFPGQTFFDALMRAGGPKDTGTLRKIQLKRGAKIIATLDMYAYRNTESAGNAAAIQASQTQLQAGDAIYMPERESSIEIRGQVRRPAIYELRDGENLKNALAWAGGVKKSGVAQQIKVNTFDPGHAAVINDVDMVKAAQTPIFDGDAIDVFPVRTEANNVVTVEGAVEQPRDYGMNAKMRVADLISQAHGLTPFADPTNADLIRRNSDGTTRLISVNLDKAQAGDLQNNVLLERWDRLHIYTREEVAFRGHKKVVVKGAVAKEGIYDFSQGMKLSDLLKKAGGTTPDAYLTKAHLLHLHDDGAPTHEYINLADVAADPTKDLALQDNDELNIYTVNQAEFTPEHKITIMGEVVNAKSFDRFEGMKLSDALIMAGGTKPSAGSRVTISHPRRVIGEENTGTAPQSVTVVLNAQRQCDPKDDVRLEDGDMILVPGLGGYRTGVDIVTLRGEVNNPGPYPMKKGMRLSELIAAAGGLRDDAFPRGAEFVRNPEILTTTGQTNLARNVAELNDELNAQVLKVEETKAQINRAKAAGNAAQGQTPISVPGATPTVAVPNQATINALAAPDPGLVGKPRQFANQDLVADGTIAVNLPNALKKPGSDDDIVLEAGDTITVPRTPTTVVVFGAVYGTRRSVLYLPGAGLQYYVDQAGGYTDDAARDKAKVFHMGAGVESANKVRQFQPGDVIWVGNRVIPTKLPGGGNSLNSTINSLAGTALLFKLFGGF